MTALDPPATSWTQMGQGEIWPATPAPKLDLNGSSDVVATSGSPQFTSATANWTKGQTLVVKGAGASSTATYTGTILSVTSNALTGSTTATCSANAGTSGTGLQSFWGTDDTVAWQTALNEAPASSMVGLGRNFATLVSQRLDTVTYTNGSSFITDASITAADVGKWAMARNGIPVNSFVGPLGAGGFTLVTSLGAPVNATANGTSVSMSIGGLLVPNAVMLCAETQFQDESPMAQSATFPTMASTIRTRGKVFGLIQCASLSAGDGTSAGSLLQSPPNASVGLQNGSGIGSVTLYSCNQVLYTAAAPTVFAPTLGVVVPNSAGWFIGSVFIPNAYWAVAIQGGAGTIANPRTGSLNVDLMIDHCYDYVNIDSWYCGVWWDYLDGVNFATSTTGLDLYAMNNRQCIQIYRCDAFAADKLNCLIAQAALVATVSPDTSLGVRGGYGRIATMDIDQACGSGITIVATNTATVGIQVGVLSAGGNAQAFGPNQSGAGATCVQTTTATASLVVGHWNVRSYATLSSKFTGSTLVVPGTNPG